MSQRIYFDNAATTPLLPEVIQTIHEIAGTIYGNPSSIHREGVTAKNLIEESRRILSNYLHTSPAQVFFTSCGTESNNMIIKSAIKDHHVKTIISSPIEHSCVLNAINQYATENNVQVIYLEPNGYGLIDIQELERQLDQCQHPVLVSLMHTNNELGSTISLEKISTICKSKNALFHSDTVQSIGLYDIDVEALQIDFISGSAHKFFGPKGIGFVYIKNPVTTKPLLYGGSQERNLRAGTENIIGIAALAKALELSIIERDQRFNHLMQLNQYFRTSLLDSNLNISFNTHEHQFNPKILNVYFENQPGLELILMNLDIHGIAVSAGSACSSGTEKSSHVIEYIRPGSLGKSVRFSFSHLNTIAEIDICIDILKKLFIK